MLDRGARWLSSPNDGRRVLQRQQQVGGSRCHPEIVKDTLTFLRPRVLDAIVAEIDAPDDHGFLHHSYQSDDHFDECNFDGGTSKINRH